MNNDFDIKRFKRSSEKDNSEQSEEDNYEQWLESEDPYKMSVDNCMRLIELVKTNSILYDRQCEESKDEYRKQQIWNGISDAITCPVNVCKLRWKSMRECYAKERRRQASGKGSRWQYYEALAFLDSHVKRRRCQPRGPRRNYNTGTNFRIILPKPTYICANDERAEEHHQMEFIAKKEFVDTTYPSIGSPDPISISSNSPTGTISEPSLPGSSTANSINDKTNLLLNETIEQTQLNNNNNPFVYHDEDELFGQSIAAELKRIRGRRKKMKLKADIFKLLCEAEESDSA